MPSEKRQRQKEREQAARAARAVQQARAKRRRNIIIGIVAVIGAFGFAFAYSVIRGGGDDNDTPTTTESPADDEATDDAAAGTTPTTIPQGDPVEPECPPTDGADERVTQFTEAPPFCLEDGVEYEAVFVTDAGDIRVALDTETTPETANNFVFLARWGYYDGTAMFRSNTGIEILQGGAPHTQGNADPGPGYTIADEGEFFEYSPGDLVMARTPAPNSSGAQYFFSTGPGTSGLAPGPYVVFGSVVEGLDVLEAIMATHVDTGDPGEGEPDPVPIVETIRIIES